MKYIFVFAHPDDESFACGGTIALLAKHGHVVKLITATRGEAGLLGDPPVATKQTIGKIREKELQKAALILGISHVYFLDFIDGTLRKTSFAKITKKVLNIIIKENPDVIITFNKEGGSRHPDHMRISKAATKAFFEYRKTRKQPVKLYYTATSRSLLKKLEKDGLSHYPFGRPRGMHRNQITTIVDIHDVINKKIEAIACHKSQHKDMERHLKREKYEEYYFEFFRLVFEPAL